MKSGYIYFLSLVLALVAVTCVMAQSWEDPELDLENKMERKLQLYSVVCKQQRGTINANNIMDDLRKNFYGCIECCLGMYPYKLIANPSAIARYKSTGTEEFGEATRKAICDFESSTAKTYSENLRGAIEANRGAMKFTTEGEMIAFDLKRDKCLWACNKSPTPEKHEFCEEFKPDPTVEVCRFEQTGYKSYNVFESDESIRTKNEMGKFYCRTTSEMRIYDAASRTAPRDTWKLSGST